MRHFRRGSDVVEDCSEVVDRFAEDLIAREADEQVAAIFAYADAGGVDESCVAGVAVLVFHCETFLAVSGFGPKPLSRQNWKGVRSKQRTAKPDSAEAVGQGT